MDPDRRARLRGAFTHAMPPEKAAHRIVRAIERDQFKLVFCPDSRVLDQMKKIAPVGTLKLMRLFDRAQR